VNLEMNSEVPVDISTKRQIVAGILSAALPGSGQLLLRRRRTGVVWLGIFVVFVFISTIGRFWAHYAGLLAAGWFVFLFALVAAYKAAFRRKTGPSRWWVLLLPLFAWLPILLMQIAWVSNGFRLYIVPSIAMQPTIWRGDRVVADLHFFRTHGIHRRDVIIYKRGNTFLVKRVEAVPGDVIQGKGGTIFLNGKALEEGFEKPVETADSFLSTFGPVEIPLGQYFVLGDNRPSSLDSRSPNYGSIKENEITGRALFVYNPFDHSHDKRLARE